MSNLQRTKFTVKSEEVKNARVSKEHFVTSVYDCTQVNGSKYLQRWSYDIYEVETSDGVFISETVTPEYKNKEVKVWSRKNPEDIGWIWLNFVSVERELDEPRFYEIQEALSLNVPHTKCFVYKIEFGKDCYVGFTTQDPEKRIAGHISKAQEGGMQEISKAFRKWGYIYELNVVGEYPNEVLGLISEIQNIEKYNCSLNEHIGGQGKDFNIVVQKNNFGENIYVVHDKNNILGNF